MKGYFRWLAEARPAALLEVFVSLLPRASSFEELEKLCREDGWGDGVGFALRKGYEEASKIIRAQDSLRESRRR